MAWTDTDNGISKLVVLKGFLTCYVIRVSGGGFLVRVNGKEVQRTYGTIEEAKSVAVKAAEKLLNESLAALK